MSEDVVFKIGDTVTLKSGGHLMTIASINGELVTCDWSVRGDIKSKSLSSAQLLKADLPQKPLSLEEIVTAMHSKRDDEA